MRSIVIKQYDNHPGLPEGNLDEVIVARVSPLIVGSDELKKIVQEAVLRQGLGGYSLEDTRHEAHWGASGITQEVIISVMQAAADPVVAGTVAALVEELIAWAKRTRDESEEKMKAEPGYGAPPPYEEAFDLDFTISWAKHYVSDRFRTSEDDLIVDEAQMKPGGAFIVLTDSKRGHVYRAEVSENGNLMRFKETRPQSVDSAAQNRTG